ncbi:hypothetical protein E3N88_23026 [Mikania micrantha]|uniref:CCHC-type domain-containing protein n=1 Tax=Mikania micrantha TaxID=192012 RepID=A0A5N6NES4_9ASTR|nr:hypothetical protein E3N88_23026 [Mikania micrantha]
MLGKFGAHGRGRGMGPDWGGQSSSRGRGSFYRGRGGRGGHNFHHDSHNHRKPRDKKDGRCYKCNQMGHYAMECTGDNKTGDEVHLKQKEPEKPTLILSINKDEPVQSWFHTNTQNDDKGFDQNPFQDIGDVEEVPTTPAHSGVPSGNLFSPQLFFEQVSSQEAGKSLTKLSSLKELETLDLSSCVLQSITYHEQPYALKSRLEFLLISG